MVNTYDDYTVGWISALTVELKAAKALLDEKHDDLPAIDQNTYTLGRMSGHNVVIACLPQSAIGTSAAAYAAANLFRSFPNVRFSLLVGVGGGVPDADVRLGDVVVSTPVGDSGGVIQYDRGTNVQGEELVRKGFLRDPPLVVRNAITKMRAMKDDTIMSNDNRPTTDEAYESSYIHGTGFDCSDCDKSRIIERVPRDGKVHYGLIGSGNQVVRNAEFRDKLFKKDGIICFEMEAAGLMGAVECAVIRGICDYCDTHKNKHWQPYASTVAAMYAKDLLSFIPVVTVIRKRTANNKYRDQILRTLYTCPYEESKNRNAERVEGTCLWFTQHPLFLQWFQNNSGILWISADPGCGKSVLARYLVDVYLPAADASTSRTICYFFFNDGFDNQKTGKDAMCALLRQLYKRKPSLLTAKVLNRYKEDGEKLFKPFSNLWNIFLEACADQHAGEVICVLDALDECTQDDAKELIRAVCEQYQHRSQTKLKILMTSRSYSYIYDNFWSLRDQLRTIHLSGEGVSESAMISKEINLVIEHRLRALAEREDLTLQEFRTLHSLLTEVPQRTYLWIHLIFSYLEDMLGVTSVKIEDLVKRFPTTLDEVYEKILQRSTEEIAAKKILQVLLAAYRPLTVNDIAILLTLDKDDVKESTLLERVGSDKGWIKKIRNICGLFVVIIDSRVYLLHQTARQFLLGTGLFEQPTLRDVTLSNGRSFADGSAYKWKGSLKLQDGHAVMSESCIRYLLLDHSDCIKDHLWLLTFKAYSYAHWASHCQESDLGIHASAISLAERLCRELQNSKTNKCQCRNQYLEQLLKFLPDHIHFYNKFSLALPAILGLSSVLESKLLSSSMSRYEISMAMQLAVAANQTAAVQILFKYGAVVSGHLNYLRQPKWLTRREWIAELILGGCSPLHQAVEHKNNQLIKLLLDRGADINSRNWDGETPLHVAVQSIGKLKPDTNHQINTESIKILLAHGANCDLQNPQGWTAAAAFAVSTCEEGEDSNTIRTIFRLLTVRPRNIDRLWPYDLWSRHLDNTVLSMIYARNSTLWAVTMLGGAALAKHMRCIDALLQIGANPKICDNRGHGLLHCAVLGGDISVVEHVLSLGVAVNDRNIQGCTPLMLATMSGAVEISKLLIRTETEVLQVDNDAKTLLMHAAIIDNDDTRLIDLYLRTNTDLDVTDCHGMTALMYAAKSCGLSKVQRLLDAGADANISNREGHSVHCFLPNSFPHWLRLRERGKCINCHILGFIPPNFSLFEVGPMVAKVKRGIRIAISLRKWPVSRINWTIISCLSWSWDTTITSFWSLLYAILEGLIDIILETARRVIVATMLNMIFLSISFPWFREGLLWLIDSGS